jgi:hypothetical protein
VVVELVHVEVVAEVDGQLVLVGVPLRHERPADLHGARLVIALQSGRGGLARLGGSPL